MPIVGDSSRYGALPLKNHANVISMRLQILQAGATIYITINFWCSEVHVKKPR